jgi:hypothetical protein
MFRPYLVIFRQLFTFRNCRTALAHKSIYFHAAAFVVHTKTCLFENETLRSALFSFCSVHVCAPFVCMFPLVWRMPLVWPWLPYILVRVSKNQCNISAYFLSDPRYYVMWTKQMRSRTPRLVSTAQALDSLNSRNWRTTPSPLVCPTIPLRWWGETQSTWFVGHCLAYFTSPGTQMMSVKQSVEWELTGETEVVGENLPQCHFVRHLSHMTCLGLELGLLPWEAADSPPELRYGLRAFVR